MKVTYQRKKNGKLLKEQTSVDMSIEECNHYVSVLKEHLKSDLVKVEIEGERVLSGHSIG